MKSLLAILFLFIVNNIYSQNLILNPSFEDYQSCPNGVSLIELANHWGSARQSGGHTDYFNRCSSNFYNSVPKNKMGEQEPRTGNGYAGFYVYYKWLPETFNREYVQGQIKNPLQAGKKYLVSFYVSLGDKTNSGALAFNTAIHSLGAYISNEPLDQQSYKEPNSTELYYGNIRLIPQIINTPGNFITDSDNWVEISGIYIASGGEKYITIGNFNDDRNTDIQILFPGSPSSYYFIDDVSLTCINEKCPTCDFEVNIGKDTTLCTGSSIILNTNIEQAEYIWQDGSNKSTYEVTSTGTYWVKTYKNGCQVVDSINIDFDSPMISNFPKDTSICFGESITLNVIAPGKKLLWSDNSTDTSITIDKEGLYWVEEIGGPCINRDTIQVKVADCIQYVPNVITPNGDEKNDVFFIKGIHKDKWELHVTNRWGKEVYTTSEYKNNWNGNGLLPGLYYYKLSSRVNNKIYKGWIQILY